MASEATLIIETELPIPFTCADGTGIEKGAILTMSDPMTAALCTTDGAVVAGIAAEEKIANDGKTKIAVYRGGIFKMLAGTNITVGQAVDTHAATGATNEIAAAPAAGDNILGIALETATDGDTLLVELKPLCRDMA
jgi:hypothetical protein